MPELPEVRNVINYLIQHEKILNKTIKNVEIYCDNIIETNIDDFINQLKNKTILNITQKGKYIIFHLSENYVLISHLRMEGKFFYKKEDEILQKHDLIIFHLENDHKLIYNDTRKFGKMSLLKEDDYLFKPPLNNVGPDPLENINLSYIKEKYNKRIPIKQLLLDQHIISGIGNIYADEILFDVGINPRTLGCDLDENDFKNILSSSKRILLEAINKGGSTIKSFHISEEREGNYQNNLKVYGKENRPCNRCHRPLRKIFLNGRGTTFCPHCQINKSLPYVVCLSGPIASGKSTINKYFIDKGYKSIDLDNIVHLLYKKEEIQNEIKKIIPSLKIIDGDIDRIYLKQYLSNNKRTQNDLENYLYNYLYNYIYKMLLKIGNKEKIIMDVPLLFKSHLDDFARKIIIVQIDNDVQKERLLKRNNEITNYLKINKSYYEQEDIKKADYLISNNGSIDELYKKLDDLNF